MSKVWWVNQRDDAIKDVWATAETAGGSQWHHNSVLKAKPGDLVLHYDPRRREIRALSQVSKAPEITREFMTNIDAECNVFKLDVDVDPFDFPVPFRDIFSPEDLAGYGSRETPFRLSGDAQAVWAKIGYFFPMPDDLARIVFDRIGVEIDLHYGDNDIAVISCDGHTDRAVIAVMRREQPELRRRLLRGRSHAECELCNRTFPAQYLVAAHIKPRSECNETERRDPRVALLACALGCDAAFERGDLYVDAAGILQLQDTSPDAVAAQLIGFTGRPLPHHDKSTQRYFAYHRDRHASHK